MDRLLASDAVPEVCRETGISYVSISHNLAVVGAEQVTDELIVMRNGQVLEAGRTARVLDAPREPTSSSCGVGPRPGMDTPPSWDALRPPGALANHPDRVMCGTAPATDDGRVAVLA